MNFADGKIIDAEEADLIAKRLPARVAAVLGAGRLDPLTVVDACEKLLAEIDAEKHLPILENIGISAHMARLYFDEVRLLFSREALLFRLRTELGFSDGDGDGLSSEFVPYGADTRVVRRVEPLGVLFHIAAGNADALPAFSVIEGLLAGNVNILKLPAADGGLSVLILSELVRVAPALRDYIYVFDYSSRDTEQIARLMDVADAVVVWGGDEAVRSVRAMAAPNTRVIEWGHKISFAYVSGTPSDADLEGIARNICETDQVFCSSCQGIFLDTAETEAPDRFGERFLPILERTAALIPGNDDLGIRANVRLRLCTAELEAARTRDRILEGRGCSVTVCRDNALAPAIQFRNCWVKALPRQDLLSSLRPHKNHLQTVALLCPEPDRSALSDLLFRAGAVRIAAGADMSGYYCGMPHDGEFALRRYTKIVSAG
jgi:hypothetical protein